MSAQVPESPAPRQISPLYQWAKRAFDLVVSCALLLLLAPLLLVVAYLVRRDSHGPALFRQERVGKDGKVFQMFKFRSMHVSVPKYAPKPKDDATDPGVTRFGHFLRQTKVDELPQLLNVARGEMSLVGPRPEMPFLVASYGEVERARLSVQPGVTGLWQVSPDRHAPIHENVQHDLYYIEHQSFWLDLMILLRTLLLCVVAVRHIRGPIKAYLVRHVLSRSAPRPPGA